MIRVATADDADAILDIYRPSIEESVTSFETEVPSVEAMRARIENCLLRYPWLVCEDQQGVCGYAYAGEHHSRAAYRWTVNVSVYIAERSQRQGIARRLYEALFSILDKQGIRTVIAGISVPNPTSHAFHEALGFKKAGVFPAVGYKLGQWIDVSWWTLKLGEDSKSEPIEVVPFPELQIERIGENRDDDFAIG